MDPNPSPVYRARFPLLSSSPASLVATTRVHIHTGSAEFRKATARGITSQRTGPPVQFWVVLSTLSLNHIPESLSNFSYKNIDILFIADIADRVPVNRFTFSAAGS